MLDGGHARPALGRAGQREHGELRVARPGRGEGGAGRPETAASLPAAERVRVVQELTRDGEVATQVTSRLLQRPRVAREAMRDDDTRFTVNRAQFDNSEQTRDKVRERMPAVRRIEHTIEYLDLVGSCHSYVATLGRLVPRMRGQEFTDDERETVRRGIAKVRGAAD
ncbi:DUF6192 family protein [Streptomyces sp. NPDC048383]|uniref:DUF6192 family protein n=1 Tax=Streptomyces sp. NPDC048383 TaxID=3155386 RepID=UPI003440F98F